MAEGRDQTRCHLSLPGWGQGSRTTFSGCREESGARGQSPAQMAQSCCPGASLAGGPASQSQNPKKDKKKALQERLGSAVRGAGRCLGHRKWRRLLGRHLGPGAGTWDRQRRPNPGPGVVRTPGGRRPRGQHRCCTNIVVLTARGIVLFSPQNHKCEVQGCSRTRHLGRALTSGLTFRPSGETQAPVWAEPPEMPSHRAQATRARLPRRCPAPWFLCKSTANSV